MRRTGIDIIGNLPWGTHFCLFYQTKEDLIDILVPYFKAGLENNEFCLWIASKPLNDKEAKKAMRKTVPNFDQYLKKGQIEIIPHTEWYLIDGVFNPKRVLNAWADKLNQALIKGYEGIRVTGNAVLLEKRDWRNFADYEEKVNNLIGKQQVIALCSYPLDKCGAAGVIDVVSNHRFALIKRNGKWERIESSERKRVERALRESEERLRGIVTSSPNAITATDLDGNITECNQATLDMHGFASKDELIGKSAFALIAKKDHKRAAENMKKTLGQGSVRNIEYTFLTKDGRKFPAELSASVIKNSSGNPTGFVAITKDITERKRAEEELKKAKASVEQKVKEATRQLKERNKAQQNFFIDLAHELKTPLTVMKGSFDLALGKAAEKTRTDPKSFTRFLATQKEEVDRIEKIINDLSTLAKADTKQLVLRFQKVRLDKIIEEACLRLRTVAQQEKKKLTVKKLAPLIVRGDRERLGQLVSNLLDNAIKFTKPGSGLIQVSLTADHHRAKIQIKDNGRGIPKKDLPHIFERFYRGANVNRNPKLRGSGLGLAICEWIVKEHRGKITVKSTSGNGTVFTVWLPLVHYL